MCFLLVDNVHELIYINGTILDDEIFKQSELRNVRHYLYLDVCAGIRRRAFTELGIRRSASYKFAMLYKNVHTFFA